MNSGIVSIKTGSSIRTFFDGLYYKIFYKGNYKSFYSNVIAMRKFFIALKEFYYSIDNSEMSDELKDKMKTIKYLSEEKRIKDLLEKYRGDKLSFQTVFIYDNLFRVTLSKIIREVINEIYMLDAIFSIVNIIKEKNMVFPKFVEKEESIVNIEGLFHLSTDNPVKNDIKTDKHLIFLTGANMSGKTTFIKSLGVAVYLAHLGIGVPANKMEISKFDGIITGIETEDNIKLGYSFFYSEVNRVKEAIKIMKEKNKVLIMFDEMFRGTNIKDAFSERVIKGLANYKKGMFIISSHLIELEDVIKDRDEILFKCFKISMENNKIKYSYKIEDGVSADRIGMNILEEAGIFTLLEDIKN